MGKLNTQLLKNISHGDCIVLIGSGISIESGFPSWKNLAKYVFTKINKYKDYDFSNLEDLLKDSNSKNLLNFFDYVEKLITKKSLVDIVKKYFDSIEKKDNKIYPIISKWPIECFLTTNYDSEIKRYLEKEKLTFIERGNTESDFFNLRTDAEKIIFKIHGTLDCSEFVIITKSDYDAVKTSTKFKYWREKLKSIFQMCNLVIIGYSAKDPDFNAVLDSVKNFMSPQKPIYMFAADLDKKTQEDLYRDKNIFVIDYKTSESGSHKMLENLLKTYTAFLPSRGSNFIHRTSEAIDNNDFTSAMFIYDELVYGNQSLLCKILNNCLLICLQKYENGCSLEEIIVYFSNNRITNDQASLKDSLADLLKSGYIKREDEIFKITEKGTEIINGIKSENDTYREKFFEYCHNFLSQRNLKDESILKIRNDVDKGLEILFRKRGIDIAKKIMLDDEYEISVEFDVAEAFEAISNNYTEEESDCFIDFMLDILEQPDKIVRDYMALMCNKYFMFHILGHDKQARLNRLETLNRNKIFIDSNIMLPLLAKSCQNHKFITDLLNDLKKINKNLCITTNILKEIEAHAYWAISRFSNSKIDNLELYKVQTGLYGYKENLFISGGMLYCNQNGIQYMDTYFEECFGEDYVNSYSDSIKQKLLEFGILIIDKDYFQNFNEFHYTNFEEYKQKIEEDRKKNNSYRSCLQCETEAELLVISELEEMSFLTMTTNLKKFDAKRKIKHWSPENLYRFLQTNNSSTDLDNLFNCMVSDIYDCGLSIINKEDLKSISYPFMRQAELNLSEIQKQGIKRINDYLEPETIDSERQNFTFPIYVDKLDRFIKSELVEENKRLTHENDELLKENKLTAKERNELERFRQKKEQRKKRMSNKRKNKHKKRK